MQDLRDERRVARDPVAHDDPPAGPGHAHHLARDVERPRREHRAEDADDEVEAFVGDAVRSDASPCSKRRLGRPAASRARVAGGDEVRGNVDAEHIGAAPGRGKRRRAVAAAEVEDLHARRDAERATNSSPLWRIVSAMRVKSPFSHSALFGFGSECRDQPRLTFSCVVSRAHAEGERRGIVRPGSASGDLEDAVHPDRTAHVEVVG